MTPPTDRPLRLGTRASALARWQADWAAEKLRALGATVEIVLIRTEGDAKQSGPIAAIGAQGVFTKELQRALLQDEIDLAVHSMKDLPTDQVEGLTVAAVPPREATGDALVSNSARSFEDLPDAAIVGTGSARRRAQLLARRPDLRLRDLRGNVDTRLKKLDDGQYDAIILAEAGLRRLGVAGRITQVLPTDVMLPAPAQGALAIECRGSDQNTLTFVTQLDHAATRAAVTAERACLRALEGGCLAAMGALAECDGDSLSLQAIVLSEDGAASLNAIVDGPQASAAELGAAAASKLLNQGAERLLRERDEHGP